MSVEIEVVGDRKCSKLISDLDADLIVMFMAILPDVPDIIEDIIAFQENHT